MWKPTAIIKKDNNGVAVDVEWSGPQLLDRPSTGGWSLGSDKGADALAERLAAAIDAGVVYKNPALMKDIDGHTYISATFTGDYRGRSLNKTLKAAGY